jgi:sortase A
MNQIYKSKPAKALVIALELLAIGLIIYLVALPFYPAIKYKLAYQKKASSTNWQDIEAVKQKTEEVIAACRRSPLQETATKQKGEQDAVPPQAEYSVSPNRVIIAKIGVNAPIIDSDSENYGLSKGAWRLPEASTPDKGGNTVITGHRFKYLPPSNLTFYLFHKLEAGDIVSIIWQDKNYYYRIKEIKIVSADDLSILNQTEKPILTMFTCDPIYSQKNRLVVVSELIEN